MISQKEEDELMRRFTASFLIGSIRLPIKYVNGHKCVKVLGPDGKWYLMAIVKKK